MLTGETAGRDEVAAVNADTADADPGFLIEVAGDAGGNADALLNVIGIDEQDCSLPVELAEEAEGLLFVFVYFDVRVGHRAGGGHVQEPGGQDVAGGRKARHLPRPRSAEGGQRSLGAAEAEVDDGPAASGLHDTGGQRGGYGRKADDVEDIRLQKLDVHQGAARLEDRLFREEDGPFGQGADVGLGVKSGKIMKKLGGEEAQRVEEVQVGGGEGEGIEVIGEFLQPGHDKIAPAVGQAADGDLEPGATCHSPVEVGLGHRQFIEIGQEARRLI